jgi:hypothetical protein
MEVEDWVVHGNLTQGRWRTVSVRSVGVCCDQYVIYSLHEERYWQVIPSQRLLLPRYI